MLKAFFVYWWCRRYWGAFRLTIVHYLLPRIRYGFRPTEIIIRKPKAELTSLALNDIVASITCAIDVWFLANNAGVNTQTNFWHLDHAAANEAFELARRGEIPESTWKTTLWRKDEHGWVGHEIWRQHEVVSNPDLLLVFKVRSHITLHSWNDRAESSRKSLRPLENQNYTTNGWN
jgi:hypothetical protein